MGAIVVVVVVSSSSVASSLLLGRMEKLVARLESFVVDEEVEAVDAARDARAEDGFGFGGVGSAPDGGVELADVLVERADAVRVGAGHLGDVHPQRFAVRAHARASGDGVVRLERARHPDGVVVQGRRVPTQLGERVDRAVLDHGARGDECRAGNGLGSRAEFQAR